MTVTGLPTLDDTQELPAVDVSITEQDRIARNNSIRNSIAITAMEGGEPSVYCRQQLKLFADGKISVTEMRDRVLRRAGR